MWLIGMMGSGKSTVGRLAADRLGIPFYDTDSMVEERAGASIPEIWDEFGETGFRRMESLVLHDVPADGVIAAAGGGAVLEPVNRDVIARSDKIVWLRCRPETLAGRLGENAGRPLLAQSPETVLTTLLGDRTPIYDDLATHCVETDARTLEDVVGEVISIWRS